MGKKFDAPQRERRDSQSPKDDQDSGIIEEQKMDSNINQSFIQTIKNNIKPILIVVSIIVGIVIVYYFMSDQIKSGVRDLINQYQDLTLEGFVLLTLIGTLMVITGAPILFFELSMGCILSKLMYSILIASLSKIFGVLISFTISRKFLKGMILSKLRDNMYFRMFRIMSRDQPAKSIGILAVISIPMLIKNYSLPLLDIHIKYIIGIFIPIQILQACLICFIGSTITVTSNNIENQDNTFQQIITYIFYIITIFAIYLIYKETQKIKQQAAEFNINNEFDIEDQTNNIEVQQKIHYLNTQDIQKTHSVKLVIPKINQEDM